MQELSTVLLMIIGNVTFVTLCAWLYMNLHEPWKGSPVLTVLVAFFLSLSLNISFYQVITTLLDGMQYCFFDYTNKWIQIPDYIPPLLRVILQPIVTLVNHILWLIYVSNCIFPKILSVFCVFLLELFLCVLILTFFFYLLGLPFDETYMHAWPYSVHFIWISHFLADLLTYIYLFIPLLSLAILFIKLLNLCNSYDPTGKIRGKIMYTISLITFIFYIIVYLFSYSWYNMFCSILYHNFWYKFKAYAVVIVEFIIRFSNAYTDACSLFINNKNWNPIFRTFSWVLAKINSACTLIATLYLFIFQHFSNLIAYLTSIDHVYIYATLAFTLSFIYYFITILYKPSHKCFSYRLILAFGFSILMIHIAALNLTVVVNIHLIQIIIAYFFYKRYNNKKK